MAVEREGSATGSTVTVTWEGRQVEAWLPHLLTSLPDLDIDAVRASAAAEGALTVGLGFGRPELEVAGRLLLRAEGLASSRIESILAPVDLVAVAELDHVIGDDPASWVAANLRALDLVLDHAGPLGVDDVLGWHRVLMEGSHLEPHLVGAWRDRLGWIGGPTPTRAAHVAAPEHEIARLVDDLVAYANRLDLDPVAQAGIVHAQFEVIHPFADGNGRLGRLLIGWVLRRRLGLVVPPPVSPVFLRDVGGYLAGLTRWRLEGPSPWVRWFAGAVEQAAVSAGATMRAVAALVDSWPGRLAGVRADAAAHRLLSHVATHPALDVATVARLLDVSDPAARSALSTLEQKGILSQVEARGRGPGRPTHRWIASELLDLLSH
jgi:Fic family protein